MAEVNDDQSTEQVFGRPMYHNPLAHQRRYPWREWRDGRIWVITEGQDFDIDINSMQRAIYQHARAYELTARTKIDKDLGTITFQFLAKEPVRFREAASD